MLWCGLSIPLLQSLNLRFGRTQTKRFEQIEQIVAAVNQLQQENPDLVKLNDLDLSINALQDEDTGQRDFWVSILMNIIFLALGFLTSHVL